MSACRATPTGYLVVDEHLDDCVGDCRGCWPCVPAHGEGHCAGRRHCTVHLAADVYVCPRCIGRTRQDLAEVVRLAETLLPPEVRHQRIESEAMNIDGPTADPEADQWRTLSAMAGRIPWPDDQDINSHPLYVLGWWDYAIREDYGPATSDRVTIPAAAAYLDGQLDRMAGDSEQDWQLFAGDVSRCKAHLEAVLHDQTQGDRANIGCFDCGGSLERRPKERRDCTHTTPARSWLRILRTYPELPIKVTEERAAREACPDCDQGGFEDHWTCRECRRGYTYAEYNFALRAALEGSGT